MALRIKSETVVVNTTGSAGSATGSAYSRVINGEVLDIYLDFHASAPATTDLTISHEDPTRGNILVRADSAADGLYAPRYATHKNTDATATTFYDRFPVAGRVKVALAQCNALTAAVTAIITYIDYG